MPDAADQYAVVPKGWYSSYPITSPAPSTSSDADPRWLSSW
ncbi:hypothetical protein WMF37_45600 [Sorangium sp. So ce291]